MLKNKTIVVVVPAFNEANQISKVIETMPEYVDKIVVVDDCSSDSTVSIVRNYQRKNENIFLIEHKKNQGVGGTIASGYKWARDNNFNIACVMAGDAQMNPGDLEAILEPVISGEVDYSKGNRLFTGEAYKKIPKMRYFGNSILSLLTKIASGYWHIADSQSGYTAINKEALHTINWDKMYKRFGQPNDLLVRLNIYDFKVKDIHIKPIYNIGERSNIKIYKVIFTISWLLVKRFLWRLKEKYIIRDFHPLLFFYFFGFLLLGFSLPLFFRIVYRWVVFDNIPDINFLAWMLCLVMGVQFILFAMWFDMERNKDLK